MHAPDRLASTVLVAALGSLVATASGQEVESFPPGPPVPMGPRWDRPDHRLLLTPQVATLLSRDDIEATSPVTADTLLGQIPGFSLFGAAPSLVADPPSLGVSLRGVGPGAGHRGLVLVDGLPVNDPFGGWVPWAAIPPLAIERVEAVHGVSPTVWGTWTGGLIHLLTRAPGDRAAAVEASYGSHETAAASLWATDRWGPWGARLDAAFLETDGFAVVRRDQRGPIDGRADARSWTVAPRLEYRLAPETTVSVGGRYFTEDRGLGTPLQTSSTEAGGATVGLRTGSVPVGQWDYTVFAQRQTSSTTVSSQLPGRDAETLALTQEIPTDSAGVAVQWTRRFLRGSGAPGPHLFTAGGDLRWTEGESREESVDPAGLRRPRRAGGKQLVVGLFGQDIDTIGPRFEVMMGARVEYWRSFDGFVETDEGAGRRRRAVADDQSATLSQRTAGRFHVTDELAVRASVAEGFRPPTLYEQYATRRVRDDVTAAGLRLDPERMSVGELGLEYRLPTGLTARATAFWNEMRDAITEVTLPPGAVEDCPAGTTCRRRVNLEETRVIGTELEGEYVLSPAWSVRAGYVYQESWVIRATAQPSIQGNRLAQVPRHRASTEVRHRRPGWPTLSARLRYVGPRYEDDLNTVRLGGAVVVDLSASAPVGAWGELFVAVENLLDEEVETGRTTDGVVTTGAPRLVRGGLRFRF